MKLDMEVLFADYKIETNEEGEASWEERNSFVRKDGSELSFEFRCSHCGMIIGFPLTDDEKETISQEDINRNLPASCSCCLSKMY